MSEIRKPITVAYAEFVKDITETVNNSGLPAFMIAPALKDIYRDVSDLAQRQLDQDMKHFKDSIKDSEQSCEMNAEAASQAAFNYK